MVNSSSRTSEEKEFVFTLFYLLYLFILFIGIFRRKSNYLEVSLGPNKQVPDPVSWSQMHREMGLEVNVKVHKELVETRCTWRKKERKHFIVLLLGVL